MTELYDVTANLPEPTDLVGDASRPNYPIDSLPLVLRDAALCSAAQVDALPDLGACMALAAVSVAVVGGLEVEVAPAEHGGHGWREPACIYVCCIAQSGEGKTPII